MWSRMMWCLVVFGLAAACGSERHAGPKNAEVSEEENPAGGSIQDADVEVGEHSSAGIPLPCGGMSEAGAAEILGVSADEITFSRSEMMGTCNYSVDVLTSIAYSVYEEEDVGTAEMEMAKVVEGLEFLSTCEPQSDLGDEAFYCSGDRADRLLVRKGAVWADVLAPDGLDAKKRVADQVLLLTQS